MGSPQGFAPEKVLTGNQIANRKAVQQELDDQTPHQMARMSLARVWSPDTVGFHDHEVLIDNQRIDVLVRRGALEHHQAIQAATGAKP